MIDRTFGDLRFGFASLWARRIVLCLFLVVPSLLAVAEHVPSAPSGVVELENHLRGFYDLGRLDPMVELSWRFEDEEFEFRRRSVTLGGYYRLLDNLKVGGFYRLQAGARHDDDWVDRDPGWEWRDTTERWENLFILDASPRFLLEFLPGRHWVTMLKSRYIYNSYNNEQSLLLRPSVTYFLMRERQPQFTISAAYGGYFSLNFGDTLLYKRGPYLSAIYHLSETLLLEGAVSRETTSWSTSEDVENSGESGYVVDYSRWVVRVGTILRFD